MVLRRRLSTTYFLPGPLPRALKGLTPAMTCMMEAASYHQAEGAAATSCSIWSFRLLLCAWWETPSFHRPAPGALPCSVWHAQLDAHRRYHTNEKVALAANSEFSWIFTPASAVCEHPLTVDVGMTLSEEGQRLLEERAKNMQRNLAMIAGLGINEHYKELEAQAAAKQKSKYLVLDWLTTVLLGLGQASAPPAGRKPGHEAGKLDCSER